MLTYGLKNVCKFTLIVLCQKLRDFKILSKLHKVQYKLIMLLWCVKQFNASFYINDEFYVGLFYFVLINFVKIYFK